MIELMKESAGPVLGFRAGGVLSDADYREVLIPALEKAIAQYGRVRCLVCFEEDFRGWEALALWDDAVFGMSHRSDFSRLAVVGAPEWLDWAVKMSAWLMDGEVRTFPREELEKAWNWVKEGAVSARDGGQ